MIYLYLKTHNQTGRKYLGKTKRDPFVYKGSGVKWRQHIKKHGNDVTTEILFQSEDPAEIRQKGIEYSTQWNIVESDEFSNLKIEEGDGGDTSKCEAYKQGIKSRNLNGKNNPMYGRSAVKERNLRWYNNGKDNIYVSEGTQPDGYCPGRIIDYKKPLSNETKNKLSKANGKKCISPKGEVFDSSVAAGKAYGISGAAIRGLIKRGKSGWKLFE